MTCGFEISRPVDIDTDNGVSGGSWLGEEWIFYNRVDAAWRPFQAWRHRVGERRRAVLEEADESFWLGLPARGIIGGDHH